MDPLSIIIIPNSILFERSRDVTPDDDISLLIDGMINLMYKHGGVGLAAPQVGQGLNLIVVDFNPHIGPIAMINPRIREGRGSMSISERCLSIPNLSVRIPRLEFIDVDFLDINRQNRSMSFEGVCAIVVQHEIDHLFGRTLLDHVSRAERRIRMRRARTNK